MSTALGRRYAPAEDEGADGATLNLERMEKRWTRTHVEAVGQVRGLHPEVIAPRWPVQRLARCARVERDDVEVCVEARIVELGVKPGMIEEERVEHDQCRLLRIEAADIQRRRIGRIVYRRIIVGRHEIDVGHNNSGGRALMRGGDGAGSTGDGSARHAHEERG